MTFLNVSDIKNFFQGGVGALEKEKENINLQDKDKDTGSNMYHTALSVCNALNDCDDIKKCCDIIAKAAVKNAKGNSGIIFAQMMRGFKRAVSEDTLDAVDTGRVFYYGKEYVEKCVKYRGENIMAYSVKKIAAAAMDTCLFTDDAFEVLKRSAKEASLCAADSGSYGLFVFLKGGTENITGRTASEKKELKYTLTIECENANKTSIEKLTEGKGILRELGEGYFKADTNHPLKILESADIIRAEIEKKGYFKKKYALAVTGDERSDEIYLKAGIELIDEDDSINADTVFVMADSEYCLERAKKYCDENENAVLVETVSLPQVMWAVTGYSDTLSPDENRRKMTECASMCRWCGVMKDEEGIISFTGEGMEGKADSSFQGLKNIIESLADENTSVISLYYSDTIDDSEIKAVTDYLSDRYKNADIETHRYRGRYLYEAGVI